MGNARAGLPIEASRRPRTGYVICYGEGTADRGPRGGGALRGSRGKDHRGAPREVADHSRDVLDVADIERVHDMRVATRRLRAALEIFEPCFPAGPMRSALTK